MLKKILFVVFVCVSIVDVTFGANLFNVSYDCGTSNGTAPTDSANYNSGDVVTVKPNTCTVPSGKHFAGYICGSTNVAAGNTFTISSNTTCTAQYENGKFAVKTTNLTAGSTFDFLMSAVGTFTVDCGDGGVLTDDAETTTVSGNTITRSNTTTVTYTCTWANAGAHTIIFDGTGTGYSTSNNIAVILFSNYNNNAGGSGRKIASISGNLAALFPQLGTQNGQIPRFYRTFYNSTNLTNIPSTLFSGYTTGVNYMFQGTFAGGSGLTSIPHDLFATFTTGAQYMFHYTFQSCTGLTSIPSDLFSSFTTGAQYMFSYTFQSCTGLTSIPSGLFNSFTTGGSNMFYYTFNVCTNLSGYVPQNFFAGLVANGSPNYSEFMKGIFTDTGLATSCDGYPNMAQYTTGYESYWDGHVSCANVITINWNGATAAAIAANNAGTTVYGGDIRTPQSYDPSQVPAGKRFIGWKFRKQVSFDLSTLDASINTTWDTEHVSWTPISTNDGYTTTKNFGSDNTATFELTRPGQWADKFSYGTVRGEARCSTKAGDNHSYAWGGDSSDWWTTESALTGNGTGRYCWCRATQYQTNGESTWQNVSSSGWSFVFTQADASMCLIYCARSCANGMTYASFRQAIYDITE